MVKDDDLKEMLGMKCTRYVYQTPFSVGVRLSQFAYFGSVGPDLPYYNVSTCWLADLFRWKKTGSLAANLLEEVQMPVIGQYDDQITYTAAFLLGYLCHIAGDITVHPYVNCYAGVYADQLKNKVIDESVVLRLFGKGEKAKMSAHQFIELHQGAYLADKK